MPQTASTIAATTRRESFSRSTSHDSSATTAGSVESTTPAAVAVVCVIPLSRQIENRKFPKKLCTNNSRCSVADSGASAGARRVNGSIAIAAMPKRRKASANTGNTATSGFDSATYSPTSAIDAVKGRYAERASEARPDITQRYRCVVDAGICHPEERSDEGSHLCLRRDPSPAARDDTSAVPAADFADQHRVCHPDERSDDGSRRCKSR